MARYRAYYDIRPQLLTIIFLCFTIHDITTCMIGLKTDGVTVPHGDIIIEYGNPLQIHCILNDDYVLLHGQDASKNIMFNRNNDSVPEEMVTTVNSSTIMLYVEKPPLSESMYYCKDKKSGHAICLNSVTVGTKPKEVTDLSCFGYNYENMTCSWTAPQNYVKTNYSLIYYFQGRSSRGYFNCPKVEPSGSPLEPGPMKCFWDITTQPLYRQSQPMYFFTLTMSNVLGNTSLKYNFSHFANVIPGPPDNLTILNKTSDSILLSWSVPIPMKQFPPGCVQRIIYQSEYDNKLNWTTADTSKLGLKNSTYIFNLTGLVYAHALYDIRVSMRSAKALASNEKLWSKFASITTRTMSKLPQSPPTTNIGSFEIVDLFPSRDIYIYWQYIPNYMKNGENCTYRVISVEEDSVKRHIIPNETTNAYAKFKGLTFESYKFVIASSNEIGNSLNTSVIYVPSYLERIHEPTGFTKIAFGEGTYELSWVAPVLDQKSEPIENYTIFWCSNERDRPYQCKGYLEWIEVPNWPTVYNITVPENEIYQFAISANTKNASSGMIWASCTVIHNNGVGKMKNLWIDHIGSTFMEVNWKLDCSDRIGSIEGFKIFYCPIISPVELTCKELERELNIYGPMVFQGNVTGLRPYTTYMLTVSVITKHKGNSLQSDRLYNTTLEAVPDSPPRHVKLQNVTNSSITVLWSPPVAMNGVLRFYEVIYISEYGLQKKKLEPHSEKNISDMEQKLVLENLRSYTEYNISISACTIGCSKTSEPLRIRTAIAMPGTMQEPIIKYPNVSLIHIHWSPPMDRGGKLDFYQLQIKEKTTDGNISKIIETPGLDYEIPNCHEDEKYKIYYFSVRAVNIDNGIKYEGKWSPESENYCRAASRFIYWLLLGFILACAGFFVLFFFLKKLWEHCKLMRDVEVKLPPGLAPTIPIDMHHWPETNKQKTQSDDSLMHMRTDTSADEELLLDKKLESSENHIGNISGDSSGCSSGQESVTSSLASGTNLSSTLDSGTEQPKTPSNESVSRENSLRLRKTGSDSVGWNSENPWQNRKGYVTMPNLEKTLPITSWPTKKPQPASNYCVLGVNSTFQDTDNNCGYVPIPKNINPPDHKKTNHLKTPPFAAGDTGYRTADPACTQPPYVITVDPVNLVTRDKNHSFDTPGYSSVLPTSKLINIDSDNNHSQPYMQKPYEDIDNISHDMEANEIFSIKPETPCTFDKTDNMLNLKNRGAADFKNEYLESGHNPEGSDQMHSYCRLGWDNKNDVVKEPVDLICENEENADTLHLQNKSIHPVASMMGYVPHRHFDNKMLKED